jgi:exodeoxyribonuclease VIII
MYNLKNNMLSLISLDLETLATTPDAAVVSLGAVEVATIGVDGSRHPRSSVQFYSVFNIHEQGERGARMQESTVLWWNKQPDEVRQALTEAQETNEFVVRGANNFLAWVDALPGSPVWVVQGADFDIPILQMFLARVGLTLPGYYRHKICLRTLSFTNKMYAGPNTGVAHNALDDAISQGKRFASLKSEAKNILIESLFAAAGVEMI